MGPSQHVPNSSRLQECAGVSCGRSCGRLRRCLLKGCKRQFHPHHPCSRYCSEACRQAADRWARWRASWHYRRTEAGRERRREQSRRYRERLKSSQDACSATEAAPREGHEDAPRGKLSPCSRPGCYELFELTARSPCQRFCSCLCRQALRAVLLRERRYQRGLTYSPRSEATTTARAP